MALTKVEAGPDQLCRSTWDDRLGIAQPWVVHLHGMQSQYDAECTFLWQQVSGTPVTIINSTTIHATFTAPVVTSRQTLVFQLTITKDTLSLSDIINIVVLPHKDQVGPWTSDPTQPNYPLLDSDPLLLSHLKALDPLRIPHGAWPNSGTAAPDTGLLIDPSHYDLLYENTRITHLVNLWITCGQDAVNKAVKVCKDVNLTNPTIAAGIHIICIPFSSGYYNSTISDGVYNYSGSSLSVGATANGKTPIILYTSVTTPANLNPYFDWTKQCIKIGSYYYKVNSWTAPNILYVDYPYPVARTDIHGVSIAASPDPIASSSWSFSRLDPYDNTSRIYNNSKTCAQLEVDNYTTWFTNLFNQITTANATPHASITPIQVFFISFDYEYFNMRDQRATIIGQSQWNNGMDARYDSLYDLIQSLRTSLFSSIMAQPPIMHYSGRGMKASMPPGFWYNPCLTTNEKGDCFSAHQYYPPTHRPDNSTTFRNNYDWDNIRMTWSHALEHGIGKMASWVSLASGWYQSTPTTDASWAGNWNHDLMNSWRLGAEINDPWYHDFPNVFAPYDKMNFIAFYPRTFDTNCPYWALHFVSYVRGANGIIKLPKGILGTPTFVSVSQQNNKSIKTIVSIPLDIVGVDKLIIATAPAGETNPFTGLSMASILALPQVITVNITLTQEDGGTLKDVFVPIITLGVSQALAVSISVA